jgi:hypothetical protein
MKKLILVIALGVSGFGFGQTSKEVAQWKKDCDCDSAFAVELHGDIAKFNDWYQNGGQIKHGDTDKAAVVGILEHIFSDSSARYAYERINPRIGKMLITSTSDVNITMNYNKWLTTLGPNKYDTSKYEFEYNLDEPFDASFGQTGLTQHETMYVKNKLTDRYDRIIIIVYVGNNLHCIIDNIIH